MADTGDGTGGTLGTGGTAGGASGGASGSDEVAEGMSEAGRNPAEPSERQAGGWAVVGQAPPFGPGTGLPDEPAAAPASYATGRGVKT